MQENPKHFCVFATGKVRRARLECFVGAREKVDAVSCIDKGFPDRAIGQ